MTTILLPSFNPSTVDQTKNQSNGNVLRVGDHIFIISINNNSTKYSFVIKISDNNTIEVKLIIDSTVTMINTEF